MENLLTQYARLVIEVQLKLREGDSLSINSEASTLTFARLLAQKAALATRQTVTIVHTNHGKVVDAIPIEPTEKEIFRPPVQGAVMCHIVDLDEHPYLTPTDLNTAAEEVTTLGKYGLLADPVFLDRRIAVPWANIPYPGPRWALQLLGTQASEEDMWKLFTTLYRIEDEHGFRFWEEQGNLLAYRKQKLNERGRCKIRLIGDLWEIGVTMAKDTIWAGGRQTLPSQRSFFSSLPVQAIHAALDGKSANGTFTSSRPFYVLGQEVKGARFTVQDGLVTEYAAQSGEEALTALFSVDENAKRVSEISLADHDTVESHYLEKSIHPLFAREMTSTIVLGGFSLDNLTTQQNEGDIEDSALCTSLVRVAVPIGDSHLSVTLHSEDGSESSVMEEGIFTEEGLV
ncbi:aminopeptidase [uncultured Sphaerochaeta sp.]|uniref:aminopeptidase n=1 Tax=uncultured Sphaerochaeta sp. TaxID=886478 RepID=UPI002AA8D066|nr:aminopeptidase [uncultured Sphaerochaeta sp.]